MDRKSKVVVLGIVTRSDGRILLTQRNDPNIADAHLLWDVPGGTNEFGESLEETCAREIKEETGIGVTVGEMLPKCVTKMWTHTEYTQHTLVFCFKCEALSDIASTTDTKIAAVRWERPDELRNFQFLPTTKEFLDMVY